MATQLTTRYQTLGISLLMAVLAGCGGGSSPTALVPEEGETFAAIEVTETGLPPETKGTDLSTGTSLAVTDVNANVIRVMAANITSGPNQSYDPGHGNRIFEGLDPDIVLIQEFNYGNNSESTIRSYVDNVFGPQFDYFRESGAQIPNGVISRYPIIDAGEWIDSSVSNRDHAWARIDIPGDKDLWVVSVHWLTTDSKRPAEATQLVNYINQNVPASDYLIVGGDFNTDSRTETSLNTLKQVVDISAPFPKDQNGREGTNASRSKPYDAVYADADLEPFEVPVVVGGVSFPSGLVFDSRVFSPLSVVAPVQSGDSGSQNMQHMAVIRDFTLPSGSSTGGGSTGGGSTGGGGTGGGSSCTDVTLTLKTDNYGSETSWVLKKGTTTVDSGSNYGNNQTINKTMCLDSGTYTFTINDSYGDGICCSYGNGSYTLKMGTTTLASGGSFGSSENKTFSVGSTGGSTGGGSTGGGSTGGGSTFQPTTLLNQSGTVSQGQWRNFTVNVPSGASKLTINMTGSGDADLYVKYGSSYPTYSSYDYRPYLNGSNESVVISGSALKTGQYWISINGYASSSSFSVSAVAE